MNRFAIPLAAFAVLVGFLAVGLTLNPRELPSAFIGRAAPAFALPELAHRADSNQSAPTFQVSAMRGRVWLLNVWASWCAACRDEHSLFNRIHAAGTLPIVGLNYKDEAADAAAWLRELGNPYTHIPIDRNGDIGIEYGVYGVPETYLIDADGIIRFKQVGALTAEVLREQLLPMIDSLRASATESAKGDRA